MMKKYTRMKTIARKVIIPPLISFLNVEPLALMRKKRRFSA